MPRPPARVVAAVLLALPCACTAPAPAPASAPVEWPELVPPGVDSSGGPPNTAVIAGALDDRAQLRAAREALLRAPTDETAIIWYGRRMAYLGYFDHAIEIYGKGLGLHPDSARLLRHRGHRFITTRRFDAADLDLERAARLIEAEPDEVEPDGRPNARGIPTSTLHTNVLYHLGLARYLQGDFARAAVAYQRCLDVARNPDMATAARYWLYLTLRRLGRVAEAASVLEPVRPDDDIIENHEYHRLLLCYRGELDPAAVVTAAATTEDTPAVAAGTAGYGLACWHFMRGDAVRGVETLAEVVANGPPNAFGCIAAEVDLARVWARHP